MHHLAYGLIAAAGLAAAASTSPIAQEMIGPRVGSLDCRFSGSLGSIAVAPVMRCTVFPAPPGRVPRTVFTGRLRGPLVVAASSNLVVVPQESARAVWYVTATARFLNLSGEYARAPSGRERLEGGPVGTRLYRRRMCPLRTTGPTLPSARRT